MICVRFASFFDPGASQTTEWRKGPDTGVATHYKPLYALYDTHPKMPMYP